MGPRAGAAGVRPPRRVAGGGSALALGSQARARAAVRHRPRGTVVRILLGMDSFIRGPPARHGGMGRVVADRASGLSRPGHEIPLWAAPGSQANGSVEPFGREGEWTRWSNLRNAATLAARFLRRPWRFDVVHNFGRLA